MCDATTLQEFSKTHGEITHREWIIATIATKAEREACAKIVDDMAGDLVESLSFDPGPYTAEQVLNGYRMIANLIRARKAGVCDIDAYYILEGKTVLNVGRDTCYRWRADKPEAKIIAQEDIGQHWVSTVFLTHDHNFRDEGPPVVFETMIFARKEDGELDMCGEYTDRCSTHDEAEQMHKRVCDELRAGKTPAEIE